MPTLAQRDTSGTFGARAGELCELPDRRTRSAKVFRLPDAPDGRKRYRIGAGIGPVHYPHDVWAEAPTWHEIDTEVRPVADGTCDYAMTACGYAARFWQRRKKAKPLNYIGEFSRGGATYRMAPLSLSWQDAEGAEETISTPTGGIAPKLDAEAGTITWTDAFGKGLSYAYNCTPDKLFKALTIRDRASLPAPKRIKAARLVLRLWVSWDGEGAPDEDLPAVAGGYQQATTKATTHRPAGRYPHKHIERDLPCFWVQPPEAWDSGDEEQQRWPLDWWYERRRQEVVLCLALDVAALEAAAYPLLMDTAISEEQVGASSDDAYDNGTALFSTTTNIYVNDSTTARTSGFRWTTIPIPAGATIDSAAMTVNVYSSSVDDPSITMYGDDEDSAATFSSTSRPGQRPNTTASVVWSTTDVGAGWVTAPSITTIISEIVARDGWASNNSLAVLVVSNQPDTARCAWKAWDTSGNVSGPKFNCSYTEGGTTKTKEIAETFGLSDSLSKRPGRVIAESVGAGDTLVRGPSITRSVTVGLTDTILRYVQATQGETLGLDDNAYKVPAHAITEALGLSDSVTAAKVRVLVIAEALGLVDVMTRGVSATRSESLGIADAITRYVAATRSDGLGLADAITRTPSHTEGDGLGLDDAATMGAAHTVAESLGLGDARTLLARHTISDALGLSDTLTTLCARVLTISETIGISDAKALEARRIVAEALGLDDAIERAVSAVYAESIGLSDAVTRLVQKALLDAFGIVDAVTAATVAPRVDTTDRDILAIALARDILAVTLDRDTLRLLHERDTMDAALERDTLHLRHERDTIDGGLN